VSADPVCGAHYLSDQHLGSGVELNL
jgi:hypothetical protein